VSDLDDLFAAGGEAGRLMAAIDWAGTPMGPVESWPASLRFAVRTVLVSRFPMVLTWGPEFRQFYNDAYAPLIGAKHPAIGEDIRLTLAEGWSALGPPIEHAMTTLEASWLPDLLLLLERAGYREETYFTVSHAPAFDDDGRVAGMHAVCTETTTEVVAARRQRSLHDLATAGAQLGAETDVVPAMCRALAHDALDVPFAAVYLSPPGGGPFELAATTGHPAGLPAGLAPGTDTYPGSVAALEVAGGPWGDAVTEAVVLPLATGGGEPVGLLVAGVSPNRSLDADYREFFELVAGQFTAAVTNSRAFDEERLRAESLAALDRAKTMFFSDVSHELRTPLTLLLGPLADVLADPAAPLPDGVSDQLELALRNGQRLQRLVNDLLEVASIEAGRAAPTRVETDVAAFTADLAGIFRAAAERAGLALTVECPALDRAAFVDPRMWEKIVVNLMANAIKYTLVGGIDVVLSPGDDAFRLTVTDTGIGIAGSDLPHLFERFHRVTGATARTREGTGIGLALVHELATLHGGTVSVSSEPGAGSAFTVTLPYGAADAAEDGPSPAPSPSEAARGEATGWERAIDAGGPARTEHREGTAEILVADDNPDMQAYLVRVLAPHWTARTASDGEAALAAVAERAPDLVLTDVMMPRIDGFELLRALRADPATRDIPVIMLTARAGQEAAVEGLDAGADDYLAKPFQAAELIARIRVGLERATGRAAGPLPPVATPSAVPAPPLPRQRLERDALGGVVVPAPGPDAATWRLPAAASSIPVLRRRLRAFLDGAGIGEDQTYDMLLAVCEAATNAVEHAQEPTEPYVDVSVQVDRSEIRVSVRDYGQWRERTPSLDRGRGGTLMSMVGAITATPGPEGTTVLITSGRPGRSTR
jgi:signal transduction histidine kinase/CheY-like chemotaxis protein